MRELNQVEVEQISGASGGGRGGLLGAIFNNILGGLSPVFNDSPVSFNPFNIFNPLKLLEPITKLLSGKS
ncbi:hypothetical protein FUT69_00930 [Xylella taiwanensis]|uniref:Bacteriocin n=1 Tax=Xylella taiwanensis TaxID=1444770 RepID=A0ABS8TTM2_9GAMM|nr:hypothetical protein [Xylella taiwanensis]MCD8456132.1 hypothetical protein [Xylella taiwanensis]MCD8458537.1 hypothetical protein [Xylella taiwanensis]MCD8460672.1 hypothetical protein [Xylella taiwanensis]MCD8463266.1 hypothetical protein [Xylella taiwanensis]MCD8465177.1 hypothetical protein [Xylella taiwanensis]